MQIFSDETIGYKKSFFIYSAIYGKKENLNKLSQKIDSIAKANKNILGNGFIEFKANKLNYHNINSLGLVYEEFFKAFNELFATNNCGCIISFYSKKKYDDNMGFLKKLIEKKLDSGEFNKFFPGISKSDYPAIYNRIDHLMLYYKYRDRFLKDKEKIDFYPDSSGKILRYKGTRIKINSKETLLIDTPFFNGIRILGNSICHWLQTAHLFGYPDQVNTINHYEPLDSKKSRLIQICDAISNFTFSSINYLKGQKSGSSEKKFYLLSKYLDCEEQLKSASKNFNLDNIGNLSCINDELKANIIISL